MVVQLLHPSPVSSGVPPGSVLLPTLLSINDLLHASVADVHSFVDDSTYINCLPSTASLFSMLILNIILLCLQLLTQI